MRKKIKKYAEGGEVDIKPSIAGFKGLLREARQRVRELEEAEARSGGGGQKPSTTTNKPQNYRKGGRVKIGKN